MRITHNAIQQPVNIVGSSKFGRYPKIDAEKTYNMLISDGWLINYAGYQRAVELLPQGEGRGGFVSLRGNFAIVVVNAFVYRLTFDLAPTLIGTLATSRGEVFIDENLNQQICIVDGVNAYIYNYSLPPNLTIQADGFLGSALIPNYVTFHDNKFLFGNANTTGDGARWFIYQFNTPTTIQYVADRALQTKPDRALAVMRIPSQANNVLVMGGSVCEIHTDVGGTEIYRRNSSVNIDYGCISISTIASSDYYIGWLAINESNQPVIMMFTGQGVQPISTDGIDYVMGTIKRPDLSTAMFYRQDGHLIYHLTFYDPQDNLTLAYDVTGGYFVHLSDENLNFHPARDVLHFNQNNYFVSLKNASIYRLSTDITVINENLQGQAVPDDPRLVHEMQRIRICETIRAPKTTPFVANTLVITIEQGSDQVPPVQDCIVLMITEDNFPGSPNARIFSQSNIQVVPEGSGEEDCVGAPYRGRVDLSISKDGGTTFSNTVSRMLNPLGHRKNILKWERMGLCNEFTPKFRFWTLGRVVVSGGVLDLIPAHGNMGGDVT